MVNRITLTLVFALSFWTYLVPEPTLSRRSAALILFAVLVFFKVFCSFSVLRATGSLFEPDGLLFLFFLSFLMLGSSLASNFHASIEYWLLNSVCLVLARTYMAVVPLEEVLEAFFWSGILSLGVFMAMAIADLTQAILSLTRFSAFAFEPNVLAFVLAGYFCAVVWKFMTGGWCTRVFAGLVGFICLAIIFFTSSRGSLVAVLVGCLFVAGITVLGGSKEGRKRSLRLGLLTSALLLGVVFAAESRGWTEDTFNFVDQVLALSAPDRGLDSGFTGRFDKWKETAHALSDGTWLTGRGLRSSDSMYPPIDNSYLVLLYEVGVFPLILITWRFVAILRRFVKSYFRSAVERQRHFYLAWTLLMVVFLVNDIVGRFMFALANPFSLLAFLIFAAPAAEMQVYTISSTSDLILSKGLVNCGDIQRRLENGWIC